MAIVGEIEMNNDSTTYSNKEAAELTVTSVPSSTKLEILDGKALEELTNSVTDKLDEIEATTTTSIEDVKTEITESEAKAIEAAKQYTDGRLAGYHNVLVEQGKKLGKDLDKMKADIAKIEGGVDTAIDGKLDPVKEELDKEIDKVDDRVTKLLTEVDGLKKSVEFNANGTLRLVAILTKSSAEVEAMGANKDTWLNNEIAANFPNGPINGYFVRCTDEICYFYINGTWHKGAAAGQQFTVKDPITFANGEIGLKIDEASGLEITVDGKLSFAPPVNGNGTAGGFDKFTRKDQAETIEETWKFNKAPSSAKASLDTELATLGQVKEVVNNTVGTGNKPTIQHVFDGFMTLPAGSTDLANKIPNNWICVIK